MNRRTFLTFDDRHLSVLQSWLLAMASEAEGKALANRDKARWHRSMAAFWREIACEVEMELRRRDVDYLELADAIRQGEED